jgi:hypothetical protein
MTILRKPIDAMIGFNHRVFVPVGSGITISEGIFSSIIGGGEFPVSMRAMKSDLKF